MKEINVEMSVEKCGEWVNQNNKTSEKSLRRILNKICKPSTPKEIEQNPQILVSSISKDFLLKGRERGLRITSQWKRYQTLVKVHIKNHKSCWYLIVFFSFSENGISPPNSIPQKAITSI